jgi:hypothetical protein
MTFSLKVHIPYATSTIEREGCLTMTCIKGEIKEVAGKVQEKAGQWEH